MKSSTKKLVGLAMFCAISYLIMVIGRIPVVMFLKYDPKDVMVAIAGFVYGPLSAFIVSVIVSFFEMITVSNDGIIGFIMNVLSTSVFVCTASFFYKKKHTIKGAMIGLLLGSVLTIFIMVLWNYFLTPIYLGFPTEAVLEILVPVIIPFNILKCGLNTAFTLVLYKPIVQSLRKAHLIEDKKIDSTKKKFNIKVTALTAFILLNCVLIFLFLKGIL